MNDCQHEVAELRRFTMSNGTVHFTLQCQNPACLRRPTGQFISRAKLRETLTDAFIDAIPDFDHDGRECANQAVRVLADAEREVRQDSWWARYDRYMNSPEWQVKRRRVIARDHGQCQICDVIGNHVHHLTYVHLENEYLFELVLLCRGCHKEHYGMANR